MKKNLVEIIRANPGAVAIVDNDCWTLWKQHPADAPDDCDDADAYEAWERENKLADDDDIEPLGSGGYGSGNCYGGDILQALAQIVGIRIESV